MTALADRPTTRPEPIPAPVGLAGVAALPLTAATVTELIGHRAYPSVSLLLTTRPGPRLRPEDEVTAHELAAEARRRLAAEGPAGPVLAVLDAVLAAASTGPVGHGLALFASAGVARRVDLPVAVVDRCVVDPTFATRDLVRALHRTPRHVVLRLSAGRAVLFDGAAGQLAPAVGAAFPRVDRSRGRRPATGRAEFHREVDRALGAYLRLHPAPLVLAGEEPALSAFQRVSRNTARLAGTLPGVSPTTPLPLLQARAHALLQRYLHSREEEALDLIATRAEQGRAVHGLDAVWRAARWERPEVLAVEEGYARPARLSPDGDGLVPADDPNAPDVIDDVVDELIETVISRGGWVALVDDDRLADRGRVALTTR